MPVIKIGDIEKEVTKTEVVDAGLTQKIEYPAKPEPPSEVTSPYVFGEPSKKAKGGKGEVTESILQETKVDAFDFFEDTLGVSVDEIITKRLSFLFDTENAKKVYLALVEDNLTAMSSTEAAANKYRKTIEKIGIGDAYTAEQLFKIAEEQGVSLSKNDKKAIETFLDNIYNEALYGVGKQYLRSFSGSSDYVSSIYPSLRQETTPLFFDTLKTAIRQASNSNIAVITRGPLEQVATIPLTFGETARAKKQLLQRGGVEAYTEAMDQLAVSSTARKLEDPALAKDSAEGY